MSPAVLLLSLLTATDPCDPGPLLPKDAETAAVYLQVARDELARGQPEAARLAMKEAVRRDPVGSPAAEAWSELCARRADETAAEAGLRQVREGDCGAAVRSLAVARRLSPDPSLALLQGVCHYEREEDAQAREALTEALAAPAEAETAALYLGLLALRQGRAEAAQEALALAAASGDPATAEAARTLARVARGEGRLVLAATLQAGYDSNAYLLPDRFAPLGFADQLLGLSVSAVLRPLGGEGPYVTARGLYRDLRLTHVFDVLHGELAAGWLWGHGGRFLRADVALDGMQLAGVPYALGYRGEVAGAYAWGALGLWAQYSSRLEQVQVGRYSDYSGWQHQGTAFAQHWWGGTGVWVGYRLERAQTQGAALQHWEQGPRAELRLGAGGHQRLVVSGGLLFRAFDQVDPRLGARRSDRVLDGTVALELDLAEAWQARLGLGTERAFSNLPELEYTRWFATVALSGTVSPW